jgi:hypothetical protein
MILAKVTVGLRLGPMIVIDAVLSAILWIGLYQGRRWAYVLTIVFVALGTLLASSRAGLAAGFGVFLVDCLVLVPVLICKDWFFAPTNDAHGAPDTASPEKVSCPQCNQLVGRVAAYCPNCGHKL